LHGREQPSKTPRRHYSNQGEFGFAPEFAFNISIEDHFLDANGTLDSREENVLPSCGRSACGNWESNERDIRDKN
jgi:hypothetical protein